MICNQKGDLRVAFFCLFDCITCGPRVVDFYFNGRSLATAREQVSTCEKNIEEIPRLQ